MRAHARVFMLATPAVFALAVLGIREPGLAVADQPPLKMVSLGEAFECTAISEVIRANNGQVPKNGKELVSALAKLGEFAQLPVPFSAVAMDSSLLRPRVILAPRPGTATSTVNEDSGLDATPGPMPTANDPGENFISTAKLTQPHLEGRLFLAANMEGNTKDNLHVKSIEFISWNARKKAFDFGVIDCAGEKPEIQILDGVRCYACHKNRGPILGQGPWSNTTHNDVVRDAAFKRLFPSETFTQWRLSQATAALRERSTFDGMSILVGEPEICDSAIRLGGELPRERAIYKLMTRTTQGQSALSLLMTAFASSKPILAADNQLDWQLDRTLRPGFESFAKQVVAIHKSMSNTLVDFSPSGSMGSLRSVVTRQPAGWGSGSSLRKDLLIVWGGSIEKVNSYDQRRSYGDPAMPSAHLPSNPRAYLHPQTPTPRRASAAVSATMLARTIGISEGDHEFMSKCVKDLAERMPKKGITPETLAKELFTRKPFADAFQTGNIPDREEFKDLFVDALTEVAKAHKVEPFKLTRGDYASGPSGAVVPGREYREPVAIPTTACMRCHDVRGAGKPSAFNPIPLLAFDPFDATSREAWIKKTNARDRAAVLAKMAKRLNTDRDMPPEDSAEFEKFRQQEAASFAAIQDWLAAELKKARGD